VKRLVTTEQMRSIDKASEAHGVPVSVLMENAGAALAHAALELADPGGRFVVLCGTGNNGGDGLVAARLLATQGRMVLCAVIGDTAKLGAEPARNLKALEASGIKVASEPGAFHARPGDVVIDAIFGTGLTRAPDGLLAESIGRIAVWKQRGAKVVSADIVSGLPADSGIPFHPCVEADVTVSFGHLKIGQALEPGASMGGRVELANIGIPTAAEASLQSGGQQAWLLEESDARGVLPPRRADTHKGSFGHVLIVAGSTGKSGAAALAGEAALRSGAGLVTLATRQSALSEAMAHAPELMGVPLQGQGPLGLGDLDALVAAAKGKQALVIGPGIPRGDGTSGLLRGLIEKYEGPIVLDADALNALAPDLNQLRASKAQLLLTPHPGEMSTLVGKSTAEVKQDRVALAKQLAGKLNAVVVLKGARTMIMASDGELFVNPTGNAGMATAGSGDVLSGVLGALLAQGLTTVDAAICAVYAHGLAGDLMVKKTGQLGLVASDLPRGLCEVWLAWGR
jgi:ADP-dependent NAD(P)H-hydrate dehydratase / NAD(P)H-hydrate epimerase